MLIQAICFLLVLQAVYAYTDPTSCTELYNYLTH